MNSLRQRYRTYGELMTELKARVSFVNQGPASKNNQPVLDSILREAHNYVYNELNPIPMRKKTEIVLEQGSFLYDWHNDVEDEDIDPGLVMSVWLVDGSSRTQLVHGVSERHREDNSRGQPIRYDTLNGQIELWPVPERSGYGLLVEYIASPTRFTQSSDRPSVSDSLVILYAIAKAKEHYRHPDSAGVAATFNAALRTAKVRQPGNKRFFVKRRSESSGQVVGSEGNYSFVER